MSKEPMREVYIYPTHNPEKDKTGNNYILFFHNAFKRKHLVKNRFGRFGMLGLFFNLSAEVFIFHWVDLIIAKQKGLLQSVLFLLGVALLKLMGKKVVWVLHNKKPHRSKSRIALLCMSYIAKRSDVVITHSNEGLSYVEEMYGEAVKERTFYIPHPVYTSRMFPSKEIVWDIIVWGTIERYKNILPFVELVRKNEELRKLKILICGKCPDPEYGKLIKERKTNNITFLDEFLQEEQLIDFIAQSKVILFTYRLDSVLSSGALVYSLNFNKRIVGPYGGAFKDLQPIVSCYKNFEDIAHIECDGAVEVDLIGAYVRDNTWEVLPDKIDSLL